MKLRTEIDPDPAPRLFDQRQPVLCMGSCFAGRIGERLGRAGFRAGVNPFGALYNPGVLAAALRRLAEARPYTAADLQQDAGRWYCPDLRDAYAPTPGEALAMANRALEQGAEALRRARWAILTLGTTSVNLRDGRPVNHAGGPAQSVRRRMTLEEVVEACSRAIEGPLHDREVIVTVSPVRYLAEGLAENALSKATLLLAAHRLVTRIGRVHYFPAYEILMDDLRDYRFYADDLIHPSSVAVEYIWEHFARTMLTPEAQELAHEAEQLARAADHRPHVACGEGYRAFCRRMLDRAARLTEQYPFLDLAGATEIFRAGAS